MKRLLLALLGLGLGASAHAQKIGIGERVSLLNANDFVQKTTVLDSRAQNCVDTLLYSELKLYRFGDLEETYTFDAWGEDEEGFSQAFILNGGSLTIDKVMIPARVSTNSQVTNPQVKVSVYNVDENFFPTTEISTFTGNVVGTSTVFHTFTFPNPVIVNANYAIVVEVISTNGVVDFIITDPTPNQIIDENLTKLKSTFPSYNSNGQYVNTEIYTDGGNGQYAQFEVIVRPIVSYSADLTFPATTIQECLGNEVQLVANLTPTGPFTSRSSSFYTMLNHFNQAPIDSTFVWVVNTATSQAIFENTTVSHTYTQAGTYQTKFYVLGGLINICALQEDGPTVTITEAPVVTFPALANICIDASNLTLSNATPNGGTYSGTGVTNGVFNPSTAGLGVHTLTYTLQDGACTLVQNQTIEVIECLSVDNALAGVTKIYPNPSSGHFNIEINSSDLVQLQVLSLDGKQVASTQELIQGNNAIQLNGLAEGVYLLKFTSAQGHFTQRITIQ